MSMIYIVIPSTPRLVFINLILFANRWQQKKLLQSLRLLRNTNIPVVARGTGTSLSGGPLPVKGGIVLDFSLWNTKLEIDPDDLLAVVSPGVITATINEKASEFGLMYPPDPSSAHVSTIGGNLAENAGGPRGLKYGVTKDYVLGLEVVTAEGKVIRTGGRTVKNVTGYDLTNLLLAQKEHFASLQRQRYDLSRNHLQRKLRWFYLMKLSIQGAPFPKYSVQGLCQLKWKLWISIPLLLWKNMLPLGCLLMLRRFFLLN